MKWTQEQQKAIDIENTNIIVSAGAGSGKTAVLTQRVIRKLQDNVNIDQLLILTFTHAAADEMKIRIRKNIEKNPDLHAQLDKLDNAYITTFDSYALSIVKKYNYLLNISKNIGIIDDNLIKIKQEEFLNEIFDDFYEQEDEAFLKLIKDFCTKDDENIKQAILNIYHKIQMRYDMHKYLDNYLDEYYNDDFIENNIKIYEEMLLKKVSQINQLLEQIGEFVDETYYAKLYDALAELIISSNYEQIKKNLKTLPKAVKNMDANAVEIKQKINELLKELKALCTYDNSNSLKQSIYMTKDYVKTIILIIQALDKTLSEYKFKLDLYEFSDIATMAINLLEENPIIVQQIKENLNEIMIDEYQDTNDLQEKFISLIENHNVYMVGDIKQSIYRFRNANPQLFKNKYDLYTNSSAGIKIDLNQNFRSRKEVVDNINLIFNLIMSDEIGSINYKENQQMIFANKLYEEQGSVQHDNNMQILTYEYDKTMPNTKEEIEIFLIARDIKEKIKHQYEVFDKDKQTKRLLTYNDIAILIDRSTSFTLYKKIFTYLNIPLCIYKNETITSSIDISIMKNIFNLILSKEYNQSFKYSFMSIARSYLFNYDDNIIFNYFMNNNFDECDIMKIIRQINYRDLNLQQIVRLIIDKFNIYQKIIEVGEVKLHLAIYDYILDKAASLNTLGFTLDDFYNYLNNVQNKDLDISLNANMASEGVKLMTIHKSKGLEFPVCYFSGLSVNFNFKEISDRFIYDLNYGIISPYIDNGIRNIFYKDLVARSQKSSEISEKVRLFYVALTRAKEQIIMVVPCNPNQNQLNDKLSLNFKSFAHIIYYLDNYLKKYTTVVDINKLNITHDYLNVANLDYANLNLNKQHDKLNVNLYENKHELIAKQHYSKNTHTLITKQQKANINLGLYFHEVMQNIDFHKPQYTNLDKMIKQKVASFIKTNIFIDALNIYKEYEFKYTKDNINYHGIIDLLIEYKDCFKIIDYKLKNTQDDAYIGQLQGYKTYIQTHFLKKVEIYLYSILDEKLIEINI